MGGLPEGLCAVPSRCCSFDGVEASEWFERELDKHFGRIVREVQDRMVIEFERRGGRNWGML